MQLTSLVRDERLVPALAVTGAMAGVTGLFALRRRSPLLATAAAAIGGATAVGAFAHWVEPAWIETTATELEWRGPPMRIVLLADLHAAPGSARRTRRIVRRTLALEPDLVLFAGDFVEGLDADPRKLAALAPLSALHAPLGVLAVLGNHDSEGDHEARVKARIERARVRVLDNESVTLANGVEVVGLGDWRAHESAPREGFDGVDRHAPTIVLVHNFKSLELPHVRRFDLALAGHTHGGQGCVPFTETCPFLADDMKPYVKGLHDWPGGGRLYVSRGLGTSQVRARIGARTEIACIDLTASDRSRSTRCRR